MGKHRYYLVTEDTVNNRVFVDDTLDNEMNVYTATEWAGIDADVLGCRVRYMDSVERQKQTGMLECSMDKEKAVVDCRAFREYSAVQEQVFIDNSIVFLYAPDALGDTFYNFLFYKSEVTLALMDNGSVRTYLSGGNKINITSGNGVCSGLCVILGEQFTCTDDIKDAVQLSGIGRIDRFTVSLEDKMEIFKFSLVSDRCVSVGCVCTDLITSAMLIGIKNNIVGTAGLKSHSGHEIHIIIEKFCKVLDLSIFTVESSQVLYIDMRYCDTDTNFYVKVSDISRVNVRPENALKVNVKDVKGNIKEILAGQGRG